MSEIKVVKSEVEAAFKGFKNEIQSLDTSAGKVEFTESKLNVTKKIEEIEQTYYELLTQYKEILTQLELNAWESVEKMIQTDEEIATKMK
ncbi:MAG: DUF5344 family protein [Priestia megaterium]|uniref:DUF5344 family protein n=1 Tax=Priestia megaterium TaxID=1404 RepID=UPI000682EC9E|nr:DUF5344 family protein [Priestia megaterium]KNH25749.1 hypothetical protein ACS78_01725 [Priestia megaterium]